MAEYRLYCLDKFGRLGLAETFQAADDQTAVRQAKQLKPDAFKCEVWRGRHLVASLEPFHQEAKVL